MGTTTTTTTSTTTTTTTTTFTTTAATSTLTTTAISSTTAKTSGMASTTASTTTTKPVTNASNSSGKGILPSNTPAISTVIGQVTTDKSLWDLFDSSKISQMLSGRETDMQEEGKIETQDTKVHPDVKVLHEDIMFEGTIEEPEATLETHKDAEIEEEAAAPESKLNIHKQEEREGNTEKPAEESHGLQRWFGFFSPRKPERESVIEQQGEQDEGRKLSVLGGEGDEIIAGDSWQRGAGDEVMDGSNVHSPTERGLLRDDQPTEMDNFLP